MSEKVILILADGMRPDSLKLCGNPFVSKFLEKSSFSLNAHTVSPSVTLPCHMSLFHSVSPQRHGILTNIYVPQVRPVPGLFEQIKASGKTTASFSNWEPLRDLSQPGSLDHSCFLSIYHKKGTDLELAQRICAYLKMDRLDFAFLYLGIPDEAGHRYGWMTPEYLQAVSVAWDCIAMIDHALSKEYTIIVTADHGGHERIHGTELPEDMLIPLIIKSRVNVCMEGQVSILDIAPTIATMMGISSAEDWEGESLTK